MAGHLVRNLEQANQDVPKELMTLAMKSSWFKNSRFRKGGKGGFGAGKSGLGFKNSDRPCLGQASASNEDALNNYLASKESTGSTSTGIIGQGRASALKSAFKSQYMSRFCKSADSEANSTNTISATELMTQMKMLPPPPPPPPPSCPDPALDASSDTSGSSSSSSSSTRKRKSRWE